MGFHIFLRAHQVLDKTDADLRAAAGLEAHNDHPSTVVPKICLFLAVWTQLGLTSVTFQPCIGSCAGLLISEKYWE